MMITMDESSTDRNDSSSSQGVASIKSDICNELINAEIYATCKRETESNEDIDLSKSARFKGMNSCEQSQNLCNNAVGSNENILTNFLGVPSTACIQDSMLDLEGGENNPGYLQKHMFCPPGFEHDQCLNVYYKPEDHVEDITSGVDSSVNNKEIAQLKVSEFADSKESNHNANRERGNYFEEESFESEKEKNSKEDSSLQSESWYRDKLKLVVYEHETEQQKLNHLKVESNEISGKTPVDCEGQGKQSEGTVESIEDVMKHLLSFKYFKVRDVVILYMAPTAKWHPQSLEDIPWSWLKEEKWRLHTYSRYPHGANKSAILLAEAGFAYLGSGKGNDDRVICYSCCAVKQDWHPSDVISEVHRHLSPDCSLVTGINCDNVPMTMPKSGLHLFNQLHESREMFASEDTRQKAGDDIDRDGLESAHANAPLANCSTGNSSTHSEENNQNNAAVPVRHTMMATQTIMRPNTSPGNNQSTANAARFSQPASSDVPSTTVTSNSILTSAASLETNVGSPQMAAPQEGQNNLPAETQIIDTSNQNVHQVSDLTAVSSATVVSQVSQGDSTRNQNSSTVAVPSVASSATTISSTTSATSSSLNTSVNQSATLSQGNPPHNTSDPQSGSRTAGRNPTYGELGIITERPKRYEFAVRAKRLESFEPWPRDHHLKKEDLADAGFYYAGYGDCARCFYCGGGLRNWEDNDNVWVEHARWFPKCAFIRQTMGQQFVDAVQDLNKSHDQITFEMVTNLMGGTAASFQLDTKNMPLKRDPAVITVLGMGYEDKDVLEAANFVKESYGILSADKLFEKLEQDGKRRRKTESPAESQAIRNNMESKDGEVMNQLKEQNNQLRQQTVCKICMDKEVAVVFLPCGHLISCTDCAAALKDCPVCRNLVRGIVRAFMA